MLISMTVRNIALIERLDIEFHKGLHVLTGETGAGKSIVVDSINLILGERADRGLIRTGCEKATVEALFDVRDCPQVLELLKQQELEAEGGFMSVAREISTSDRNICRICGVMMPLAFLRQLSGFLVDIHGQHEHQSLLDERNHLAFLDSFGDDAYHELMREVDRTYHVWRESSAAFLTLRKKNEQREQRMEYITSRCKELEAAKPEIGEEAKLQQLRAKFADAERISRAVETAYHGLSGDDARSANVLTLLKAAVDAMGTIADYDERYKALLERLSSAYYEAEEMGIELRDLYESEGFDAAKNDRVMERLDLYRRLEKRYDMDADELADYAERLKDELKTLRGMDESLQKAESDFKKKLSEYRKTAARLSEQRHSLAKRFETMMENQLKDLGMASTHFECVFKEQPTERRRVPSANGEDTVEFFIAPNVGEPLKPLAKTASGGELSRIMLAMKAAAADRNLIPTMIFDEIDTGISGHIASVVGEKMDDIARYRQVVCVTHLAQIAAMADTQYRVQKHVVGERTVTTVEELSDEQRVQEVARLVGADEVHSQSGVEHARAMILAARERRTGAK